MGWTPGRRNIFLFPTASRLDLGPTLGNKAARGVKQTPQLHLVLSSRKVELYLHSSIYFHGIVLD
jgi:hypothetical protein